MNLHKPLSHVAILALTLATVGAKLLPGFKAGLLKSEDAGESSNEL